LDSQPGSSEGHEEGGFIVRNVTGRLEVIRWPRGAQDAIVVPPHPGCRYGTRSIELSFHTHPNTGSDYLQEPSDTDRRAVRDDPNLKGASYLGELVISHLVVYLVAPTGYVTELGATTALLDPGSRKEP
jgi:hypothetical protein